MNKAFTKEDDGGRVERLPDLPLSPHPNHVTPEGLVALRKRLEDAQAELTRVRAAAPAGAERPEDLQRIAVLERDLRWLEARVSSAILIDPARQPRDRVAFGATVTVADEDDRQTRYRIVGEDEADPARGLIALHSPLARALVGQGVGDLVQWSRPNGMVELEIIAIA